MRFSTTILPALSAVVLAAPAPILPVFNVQAADPNGLEYLSDYFNLLAKKVQAVRFMSIAPVCDLKQAKLPVANGAPEQLPAPAAGTRVKAVTIGRGTQNYTCDTTNTTAVPQAAGAVATLFDASCYASTYPELLDMLPRVSMLFNISNELNPGMEPTNLPVSGIHYFTAEKVPFFDLDSDRGKLGRVGVGKNASIPAPTDAPLGQQNEPSVPWLRLTATKDATGDLLEVYRVGTAGGSAPASCQGMPATFEVEYAAQYWFFQGEKKE